MKVFHEKYFFTLISLNEFYKLLQVDVKIFPFTFPYSGCATDRKISALHFFTLEFIESLCEEGKDGNPYKLSNSDE